MKADFSQAFMHWLATREVVDGVFPLFMAGSNMRQRAKIVQAVLPAHADQSVFVTAVAAMAARLPAGAVVFRLEWPRAVTERSKADYCQYVKSFKRNYCREGVAFLCTKSGRKFWLTETELNANAMLYGGTKIAHAQVNDTHFRRYLRERSGEQAAQQWQNAEYCWTFNACGYFWDTRKAEHGVLESAFRMSGYRRLGAPDAETLRRCIDSATEFLLMQLDDKGRYVYGYFPCFNRKIETYNALRHAGATYALLEVYEHTGQDEALAAARKALQYLTEVLLRRHENKAYILDTDNEYKLGGNALTLLALVKYAELTGTDEFDALMTALAEGIFAMQEADGRFIHVLQTDLSLKETFRTIYYDGEAAFALLRLYGYSGNQRWLDTVVRAFDYFIVAEHWRSHDHWLSYCVNELTRYCPEPRYFRFAVENIAGYMDFIENRLTTFPTLLELAMAFIRLLQRLEHLPQCHHVLHDFDVPRFLRAVSVRARYLLNGYFWPELAMFYALPAKIEGSFFIRHHAFRVRIDDEEHYLSGLCAYRQFMLENLH